MSKFERYTRMRSSLRDCGVVVGIVGRSLAGVTLCLLTSMPIPVSAEIIWRGDFETGNFLQWHAPRDKSQPWYWGIPQYGRPARDPTETNSLPPSYYGAGSLARIVTSPVREGSYAAEFTVKNSTNGSEPADSDNGVLARRRSELWANKMLSDAYNAIPYLANRWISVSVFVPEDWDAGGSGWGPIVWQMKPRNESGLSPAIAIELKSYGWEVLHRWDDAVDPSPIDVPWQQQMYYNANYPTSKDWSDGLSDFPDVTLSRNAFATIGRGEWTDWVVNLKSDARGSLQSGTGFIRMWKRTGSGPWVEVLHITPKVTTRGGLTFDHGVTYNSPAGSNNGGFGVQVGLYMDKEQVWNLSKDRVVVIDNVKVGGEATSFSQMSPDGSSPEQFGHKPLPPALISVQ